jgi:hypothetical protein
VPPNAIANNNVVQQHTNKQEQVFKQQDYLLAVLQQFSIQMPQKNMMALLGQVVEIWELLEDFYQDVDYKLQD